MLGKEFPDEVAAKYCHEYVYRGITSMEEAKAVIGSYAEDARWFMIEGGGWAMYPISGGREVNIVAFIQDENPWKGEQAAREVAREEMEAEFVNFDHRLRKLLDVSIGIIIHFTLIVHFTSPKNARTSLKNLTVRQADEMASILPSRYTNLLQKPNMSSRRLSTCFKPITSRGCRTRT